MNDSPEIQRLEKLRTNWRRFGLVCGGISLADPFLFAMSINQIGAGGGLAGFMVGFTVFSSIPALILGFVGMAMAISYRSKATKLRRPPAN